MVFYQEVSALFGTPYFAGSHRLFDHSPFKRNLLTQELLENKIPPYDLAIEKLNKIRQEKLWQQNRHKEYHSQLTDVLREYIDGQFMVPAPEMTSAEILAYFNYLKTENKEIYYNLHRFTISGFG